MMGEFSHKLDEVEQDRRLHHRHPPGDDGRDGRPEDRDKPPAGRDDGRLGAALAGDRATSTVTRGRHAAAPAASRGGAGRQSPWSTTPSSPCTRRGSGNRRRRGQRASRTRGRNHGPAAALRPARSARREDIAGWARAAPRGRRIHPGGPAPPGPDAGRHALGEPDPRPPDPKTGGEGAGHRPKGPGPTPDGS